MKGPPSDDKFAKQFSEDFENVDVEFCDFNRIQELYETEYLTIRARPPEKISFTIVNDLLHKIFRLRLVCLHVEGKNYLRFTTITKREFFKKMLDIS